MNTFHIYIIFILLVLFVFFEPVAGNFISRILTKRLYQKDLDGFDKLIGKKIVKYTIPPFNIMYARLNRAFIANDTDQICAILKEFDSLKMTDRQKEIIYAQGFKYFLSIKSRKQVDLYYSRIKELNNTKLKQDCDRYYDIYVLKGWRYLDEFIQNVKSVNPELKPLYDSLIAMMYYNKGEQEKAEEYEHKFLEKVKE